MNTVGCSHLSSGGIFPWQQAGYSGREGQTHLPREEDTELGGRATYTHLGVYLLSPV